MSESKFRRQGPEMETLGVLSVFFLVLNVITGRPLFVYAALGLLLTALFVKPLARIISRAWLKFAEILGTFNSRLILSLVFYLFLTPLALLYRTFNKNPLSLKPGREAESLFVVRDHTYTKADFEKMW